MTAAHLYSKTIQGDDTPKISSGLGTTLVPSAVVRCYPNSGQTRHGWIVRFVPIADTVVTAVT